MNGRVAKKIRRELRRRYRFDIDGFVGEVMNLSFDERWNFCWRVMFRVGRKEMPWYKRIWNYIRRKQAKAKTGR